MARPHCLFFSGGVATIWHGPAGLASQVGVETAFGGSPSFPGMEVVITRRGVEIPKPDPRMAALVRKELRVAPVSLNNPFPAAFNVYLDTPEAWVVPLHWARTALAPFGVRWTDRRGPGQDAVLTFDGALRPELRQPEAVAAVEQSWTACGGALLCLPVGFGKVRGVCPLVSEKKSRGRGAGRSRNLRREGCGSVPDRDFPAPWRRRAWRSTWRPWSKKRRWCWCTKPF